MASLPIDFNLERFQFASCKTVDILTDSLRVVSEFKSDAKRNGKIVPVCAESAVSTLIADIRCCNALAEAASNEEYVRILKMYTPIQPSVTDFYPTGIKRVWKNSHYRFTQMVKRQLKTIYRLETGHE